VLYRIVFSIPKMRQQGKRGRIYRTAFQWQFTVKNV
jgi:hypothetical protein